MDRILSQNRSRDREETETALYSVPKFELAGAEHPAAFLAKHLDVNSKNPEAKIKASHGTTTLAFVYQGGIIVSVDSRATQGPYIASGTVKKVIEINSFMLGTMAGGAADCQFWETYLGIQCRLYELRNKERISIAAASKILSNILEARRGMGLSMGTMICGFDKSGPAIYYVDSDGGRYPGSLFCVGSGQSYAFGVLDLGYRYDLTDDEAKELGRRAIYHAGIRDAYSGNSVNVYHIKPEGWENCGNTTFNELHYERGFGYEQRTGHEQL